MVIKEVLTKVDVKKSVVECDVCGTNIPVSPYLDHNTCHFCKSHLCNNCVDTYKICGDSGHTFDLIVVCPSCLSKLMEKYHEENLAMITENEKHMGKISTFRYKIFLDLTPDKKHE